MPTLALNQRRIGPGEPCYVIAEMSGNHNQSFERAIDIVRAAKASGADAVKLQTYTADTLTIDSTAAWFQVPGETVWGGRTLHQLYREAYTPWEWQPDLIREARTLGLDVFSTPFDETAVEFLERCGIPAYKIASFEIVDLALLRVIGATRKPVIMSTGMATLAEIEEAVITLRSAGTKDLALLKCTSAYPASPAEMNLRTIPHLAQTFGVPSGLSDHTLGSAVAIAAVALGASIIEKHFTFERAGGGPDAAFSMEPAEFAGMVKDIRNVEQALGGVSYQRTVSESKNVCFRRSLFVIKDVVRGEQFTPENIRSIRPGYGLAPRFLPQVLGKTASCDIARGTPLAWDHISSVGMP
jgi:N-acetylneuraminate synthase